VALTCSQIIQIAFRLFAQIAGDAFWNEQNETEGHSAVSNQGGRRGSQGGHRARKAISRCDRRTMGNRDLEYIPAQAQRGHSNFERTRSEAHKEYLRPALEHMDQ
jgi:hypothetical protein